MYCIKCGKQLPDDSRFCDACGTQLVPDKVIEEKKEIVNKPKKEKVKKTKKERQPLNKKTKKVILFSLCFVLLLAILIGVYTFTYRQAVKHAETLDFENANRYLYVPQITKLHDPKLLQMLDAEKMLAAGNYEEAQLAFQELIPYRNTYMLANEAMYQRVIALEGTEDYKATIEILQKLSDADYKDADERLRSDWQNYALSESYHDNHDDALSIMSHSEKLGYYFDNEAKQTIQKRAYDYAVKEYRKFHRTLGSAEKAIFKLLNGYKRADDYLFLATKEAGYLTEEEEQRMISLVGFEDAGERLFYDNDLAFKFLKGKEWTGSCGTMRFYNEGNDYYGTWNINGIPSGHWYFANGRFYVSDKAVFSDIKALSENEISITLANNGKTYNMSRN